MKQDSGHLNDAVRRLENVQAVGPVGFCGLQPSQQVPSASGLSLATILPAYGPPLFRLLFTEPSVQQLDHYLVWASPAAGIAPSLVGACGHSPCTFSLPCPGSSRVTAWVQTVLLGGQQSPFSQMPSAACTSPLATVSFGSSSPAANFHGTGSTILGAAGSAVPDALIANGQVNVWIDQTGNKLTFRVRYPNGTLKSGTVTLT